jgi:hypothetical protein
MDSRGDDVGHSFAEGRNINWCGRILRKEAPRFRLGIIGRQCSLGIVIVFFLVHRGNFDTLHPTQ